MIMNYACLSSCFPNICSAARGVFDGSAPGSILAASAHLLSLYVVGNITEYKKLPPTQVHYVQKIFGQVAQERG